MKHNYRRSLGTVIALALSLAAASALGQSAGDRPVEGKLPAAPSPEAQAKADSARYAQCMNLARADPDIGRKVAQAWRADGGGMAARHCTAVALLGLGNYAEAAQLLRTLADSDEAKAAGFRFDLLTQSANAWLIAGKPTTALEVQTAALEERPNDVELLIDRSISLASTAKYWEALDDLSLALDLDPKRVDALIFRASAYRRLDALDLAETDVERALAILPDHPEALLERGNIRRLKGDKQGARKDWFRVVETRPDSPEATAARLNLQRLDGKKR